MNHSSEEKSRLIDPSAFAKERGPFCPLLEAKEGQERIRGAF